MTTLPIAAALGAAACFAMSTSLQHHSASGSTAGTTSSLLRHLASRPLWLAGLLISAVGLVLHALAVHSGALTLVQPLMATGMVFALPVRAALDRHAPSWPSVGWAALAATGLALFLAVANPTAGQPRPDTDLAAVLVAAGICLAGAATWAGSGRRHGPAAGLSLGIAAGVLFGLVAGLLKMTTTAATGGPWHLLTGWPPYALVAVGAWGLAINQRAYQAAALAVSMPLLNIIDPLVAIVFGAYVFGERPSDHPAAIALEALGVVLAALGLTGIARSEAQPTPADGESSSR